MYLYLYLYLHLYLYLYLYLPGGAAVPAAGCAGAGAAGGGGGRAGAGRSGGGGTGAGGKRAGGCAAGGFKSTGVCRIGMRSGVEQVVVTQPQLIHTEHILPNAVGEGSMWIPGFGATSKYTHVHKRSDANQAQEER